MLDPTKRGPFIVGFNGPPHSGKDTLATALVKLLSESTPKLPVYRQALAATMRDGAMAILGLSGGDKFYADIKDKPLPVLNGETFRRFMIDMSEVFVKQVYGQDFWSRLLYTRNQAWWYGKPAVLIVTDIGFSAEVDFFCEHSTHFICVQVSRKGTDFSKDSRSYCWVDDKIGIGGDTNLAYSNNGTPEEGAEQILRIMYENGWPVL